LFFNHFSTSKSAFSGMARKGNLGRRGLRCTPLRVLGPWRKPAALLWLWSMRTTWFHHVSSRKGRKDMEVS
jgi:hypothetical protein